MHLSPSLSTAVFALLSLAGASRAQSTDDATAAPARVAVTARPEPAELRALRLKAERGNAVAQYNLGLAYADGRQVPVDLVEAHLWLTLASGNGGMGRALDTISSKITPAEVAESHRRLEALRASNSFLRPTPTIVVNAPAVPPAAAASPLSVVGEQGDLAAAETAPQRGKSAAPEEAVSSSTLAMELSGVRSQLKEALGSLAAQSKELAATRAKAEAARMDATRYQEQLARFRDEAAATTAAVAAHAETRVALENERATQAATQTSLAELRAQFDQAMAARNDAEQKLRASIESSVRNAAQVQAAAEQVAALQRQLQAAEGERATLQAEKDRLEVALRNQSTQATAGAEVAAKAESLSRQLAEAQSLIEALRAKVAALTSAQEGAAGQLARLKAENENLTEQAVENRALQTRIRMLESQTGGESSLQTALAAAGEKANRTAAAHADTAQKLATALRAFTLLSNERDALKARVAEVLARPAPAPVPDPGTLAELESLRQQLAGAERTAMAAQKEIARLGLVATGQSAPLATQSVGTPWKPAEESPSVTPAPAVPPAITATPASPPPVEPALRVHTIREGETLSGISRFYYGTAARWPEILAANRDILRDERSLVAGRTLKIP